MATDLAKMEQTQPLTWEGRDNRMESSMQGVLPSEPDAMEYTIMMDLHQ